MDPDGRNRTRLADPSSPGVDGERGIRASGLVARRASRLAFATSSRDAVGEDQRKVDDLRHEPRRGRSSVRSTQDDVYDAPPAWSPDGRRLAFAHTSGPGDRGLRTA